MIEFTNAQPLERRDCTEVRLGARCLRPEGHKGRHKALDFLGVNEWPNLKPHDSRNEKETP